MHSVFNIQYIQNDSIVLEPGFTKGVADSHRLIFWEFMRGKIMSSAMGIIIDKRGLKNIKKTFSPPLVKLTEQGRFIKFTSWVDDFSKWKPFCITVWRSQLFEIMSGYSRAQA